MTELNTAEHVQALGQQAKQASALMAKASAATKNKALRHLAALLRENTEALASAVAAVGGAVRAEVRGTETDRAEKAAADAALPVRRSFERDSAGRISAYIEESGGVTKRTTILRDSSGQLAGTVTG